MEDAGSLIMDGQCHDLVFPEYSGLGTRRINSSLPGQNGYHFADDDFRCIFVNEKFRILIKISLKFVP